MAEVLSSGDFRTHRAGDQTAAEFAHAMLEVLAATFPIDDASSEIIDQA
ncbi:MULTISPECIES: hypothetical protein [unclassified Kribbella]